MSSLVYAPTIISGGGLTLLIDLINETESKKLDIKFIVNKQLKDKVSSANIYEYFEPGIWNRLKSELNLRKNSKNFKSIIMFCNLPPWFELSCEVNTFVQNRLILEMHPSHFKFPRAYLRIKILSFLFKIHSKNSNKWIVQTKAMKQLLLDRGIKGENISIFRTIPTSLHKDLINRESKKVKKKFSKFLSVTNPEPHKHNDKLVDAWVLLAKEGFFPELIVLTTKLDRKLKSKILKAKKQYSIHLSVLENIHHSQTRDYYRSADCLVFTSGTESLGLPLIEAKAAKLPIIASDKDFVHEVSNPISIFDPENPLEIKESVVAVIEGKVVDKNEEVEHQVLDISEMVIQF